MAQPHFDQLVRDLTILPQVDLEAIRQEWLALQPPYQIADRHLPMPVWARRSFTESGEMAWQTLCHDVPRIDPKRALCIYIHIPFCKHRCHFCDCYSFKLGSHHKRHIDGYLANLDQEIALWSQLGSLSSRPVSTVHFGGGTPTFLGVQGLQRLVRSCQEGFSASPDTEWALESTASDLTPEMTDTLDVLGFTRLHIGVQTLQDEVRQALSRQMSSAQVRQSLASAIERGWIVSVDLIFGLPGQTISDILSDIRSLSALGVNGFSLYELQISSRNASFAEAHDLTNRDRRLNYLTAQAAAQQLVALGYKKTLFNHYADERDTNLYFTFPERGEDCLALGTIADGYFGDYHYRHPQYAPYNRSIGEHFPGLQGGLRRNELENRLQPLTIGLLAGSVCPSLFSDPVSQALLDAWQQLRFLEDEPHTGILRLTGSGSWFVGNMISEMLEAYLQAEQELGESS